MSTSEFNEKYGANFKLSSHVLSEQLIMCMRCGLCLEVCPTYSIYKTERTSPRGRLALMRAVDSGQLTITEEYSRSLSMCLGCLACQDKCPAGVPFGSIIEIARDQVTRQPKNFTDWISKKTIEYILRKILFGPRSLETHINLLRLYQKSGLQRLNLSRLLSPTLGNWEKLLPEIQPKSAQMSLGNSMPSQHPIRGKVGLLVGCIENVLLSKVLIASAQLLLLNGYNVVIPQKQVCCGALSSHIGYLDIAREQARLNIEAFEIADVDFIVSDAAGCSAQLKEYGYLLANDMNYASRALSFSSKVRDLSELLCEILPLRGDFNRLDFRVAFDDPCHLLHKQRIFDAPRKLLRSIPGLQIVDLPESEWCCGSAGTYNLTHPNEAEVLLKRKMEHVTTLGLDKLITSNTGCFMQLSKGVRDYNLSIDVMHISEILIESCAPGASVNCFQ